MHVAVDLMGSDASPDVLYQGVVDAALSLGGAVTFVVLATQEARSSLPSEHERIEMCVVEEEITMSESPLYAVRRKKSSSLVQGLRMLANGSVGAFVSAGNTGALAAGAALFLPLIPGISRPALLAVLPTEKDPLVVLDVGGQIDIQSEQLVQFAHMGAAYHRSVYQSKCPRVALLNIGIESGKGTEKVRRAYQELEKASFDHMVFVGNVEGREVFHGDIDVLVTDGFTGNIFLKTSEGISQFVFDQVRRHITEGDALSRLHSQFDYSEYPGAILCGVEGVVIKCHGEATASSMCRGILGAVGLVEKDLIHHLKRSISE